MFPLHPQLCRLFHHCDTEKQQQSGDATFECLHQGIRFRHGHGQLLSHCVPYAHLSFLQALQEGLKQVGKSQKAGKQGLVQSLSRRIAATTAFLQAQQLFQTDAASAVQICNGLIVEV